MCPLCKGIFNASHGSLAAHYRHCRKRRGPVKDKNSWQCRYCTKTFATKEAHKHHEEQAHETFVCKSCGASFTVKQSLIKHTLKIHSRKPIACEICGKNDFRNRVQLKKHRRKHETSEWRMKQVTLSESSPFKEVATAHARFLRVFAAEAPEAMTTIGKLKEWIEGHMTELLQDLYRAMNGAFKFFATLHVSFTDVKNDDVLKHGFLQTKMRSCYSSATAADESENVLSELQSQDESRAKSDAAGSQWVLRSIDSVWLNVSKYQNYTGGSRKKYTDDLPDFIVKKRCLHIEQWTDHCLFHCIAASNVLGEESHKIISRSTLDAYPNVTDISKLKDIEKRWRIGINVYSYNDQYKYIFPVRVNQEVELEDDPAKDKIVNVFLYNTHYYWINKFNRFAGQDGKRDNKYCWFCLNSFRSLEACRQHMKMCRTNTPAALVVPSKVEGKPPLLKFTDYSKCFWQPFVVYADFESLLIPVESSSLLNTRTLHSHKIFAYSYVLLNENSEFVQKRMFIQTSDSTAWTSNGRHEQTVQSTRSPAADMLLSLFQVHEAVDLFTSVHEPMDMSTEDTAAFEAAAVCHVCRQAFGSSDDKVRDHNHLTGRYRGAAHQACNRMYRPTSWLTVVMHNLSNYDMHPLMVALSEIKDEIVDVSVVPQTSEKYTTMMIKSKSGALVRFIDSMRFLNSSLETLASALVRDKQLPLLQSHFPRTHRLLKGKQVFPYEHLTSYETLSETALPAKERFFNSLTKRDVADDDYRHAQDVWEQCQCTSMMDYVGVYLWTDVVLLAEVFENFRRSCHSQYGLDPLHYISTPQLAFDAALFVTRVGLELMTDIDQILFVREGIRGGVSMISQRYSAANNPLMGSSYKDDPMESSDTYILYADVNNLYGYAMNGRLPVGGFQWCSEDRFDDILLKISETDPATSNVGWILEVDLEYPDHLHDDHNDLPLAPEKITINELDLSVYQLRVALSKTGGTKKLVPHLMKRTRYIVHFAALKYYLDHFDVPPIKVHRVLKFRQEAWLKPYIEMNTELRAKCKSAFEKDMYKLMNNAVYGKTMENVWNRKEVKICWTREQLLQCSDKPWFRCFQIVNTDVSICVMKKRRIVLNKPLYLGFSILDLSKVKFYSCFYEGFKLMWPTQMKLLMVDTDSYIMEIKMPKGQSLYQHMYQYLMSEEYAVQDFRLDYSNYKSDDDDEGIRKLASVKDCDRRLGAVKDEMGSNVITEFIGLRPKLYAIRCLQRDSHTTSEIIKAKGTPKAVVKTSLNFDHFLTMMREEQPTLTLSFSHIRSFRHEIGTVVTRKRCLSIADDKRFIDAHDFISTLSFGHKKLRRFYKDTDD